MRDAKQCQSERNPLHHTFYKKKFLGGAQLDLNRELSWHFVIPFFLVVALSKKMFEKKKMSFWLYIYRQRN